MSTEPQMVKITNDLDTLAAMMSSRKGALNSNFFDAVMVYNYQNVMFSREAYELSKETADAIVSQYIAAALVYLRSLEAEKAIGEYDDFFGNIPERAGKQNQCTVKTLLSVSLIPTR